MGSSERVEFNACVSHDLPFSLALELQAALEATHVVVGAAVVEAAVVEAWRGEVATVGGTAQALGTSHDLPVPGADGEESLADQAQRGAQN